MKNYKNREKLTIIWSKTRSLPHQPLKSTITRSARCAVISKYSHKCNYYDLYRRKQQNIIKNHKNHEKLTIICSMVRSSLHQAPEKETKDALGVHAFDFNSWMQRVRLIPSWTTRYHEKPRKTRKKYNNTLVAPLSYAPATHNSNKKKR